MGILKHKVMDHYRKSARDLPMVEDEQLACEAERPFEEGGEWHGHWRNSQGFGPRDWGPDPAGALEKKEFWKVLRECLRALPERLARAFSLREMDGCETEEICKVLDISATNLWVMLHRGRRQLRHCIERLWFADNEDEDR
jgi:RNA polymerase sigma-70 factor (ECF subfamily)